MSATSSFSSTVGPVGSWLGWMFLPNMVTGWIQTFLYRLLIRAGDPIPQQGTPRFIRDRKRVYAFVILAYLAFTVYECWVAVVKEPTFYAMLGVPADANERMLKSQFRKATVKYHPDKAGPENQHLFMAYKLAFDVLSDPAKRFAYERFGPSIVSPEWSLCKTQYDFVSKGFMTKWPNYVGSLIVLTVLSVLGKFEFGKYWRFLTLLSTFLFDVTSITRPYFLPSTWIIHFFTRRTLLPFEQVFLAQQISFSVFIAISQLTPLFHQPKPQTSETMYTEQLDRLMALAVVANRESRSLAEMETAPFVNADGTIDRDLKMKMQDWLVERRIESEPEMRDAMGRVIARRRQEKASRK